jgi:DNA-binding Xre family transcriptional regulator
MTAQQVYDLMRETGIGYTLAREIWKEDPDLDLKTSTLDQLAQKLNVRVADLLDDSGPKTP